MSELNVVHFVDCLRKQGYIVFDDKTTLQDVEDEFNKFVLYSDGGFYEKKIN